MVAGCIAIRTPAPIGTSPFCPTDQSLLPTKSLLPTSITRTSPDMGMGIHTDSSIARSFDLTRG